MNLTDLNQHREKLERLALTLREGLATSMSTAAPVAPDNAIGRLTRLDAMQAQQMALALRERQRIQLQKVEQALRLIEKGEYGTCRKCGEEIAAKRLEVAPESTLCVHCAR
jgi:DnaK suppressor protein